MPDLVFSPMNVRTINEKHFKTIEHLPVLKKINYEHENENTSGDELDHDDPDGNECRSMVPKLTDGNESETANSPNMDLKSTSPAPYWDEMLPMLHDPSEIVMNHRKSKKASSKLPAY